MNKLSLLLGALVVLVASACDSPTRATDGLNVLVFSKTDGFRHESIEDGIALLEQLSIQHDFNYFATENAEHFQEKNLKYYDVILFMNTTGDVLDDAQQLEMQRFIQAGGGFVGVHAAADTEYDWPWYGQLVGAYFNGHPNDPNVRDAVVERWDSTHISCSHLPALWPRTDEWYDYKDIQEDISVLLNLDEDSYEGGTTGDPHPIAWYKEFDGGRTWYTGGGHTRECFQEEDFVKHLWGGIQWAAGEAKSVDYSRTNVVPAENRFEKVVLTDNLNEPMELDMLPDGRLLFIERKGDIIIYDPQTEETEIVDHLDIHTEFEDGLLGLAIDPNFAENKWVYLFYSPLGDDPKQNISRFVFQDDKLDRDSEKVLIEIGTQRDQCCHSAGSLEFGPAGNLWFSAGDDTNPFDSDGYSPSDERPGRSPWDAQKSSANTMDLRGKVSRITPQADGTYSIPEGNLFPKDGSVGRPEIYAMGCRNPYRISIDSETGFLYWGDVGPDAGKDSLRRGARGHDEVNQARKPGFFGWPYFIADNKPYYEYDFALQTSLQAHDPEKPINNSPNNTGARELPPANAAFIFYPYAESEEFPLVGTGGRNAMAGPVYHRDKYPEGKGRFPDYYDGKLFTYDWMRGWIMAVTMNDQGDFMSMERFMPSHKFSNPNDIIMGPNGDFFMLEYGTAWFSKNKDARLVHITYNAGNRQPKPVISASESAGAIPFEVTFTSEGTVDPDGDELAYRWDFGDGSTSSEVSPVHTFEKPGNYDVRLTVTDPEGEESESMIKIGAGNAPPQLAVAFTGNQSFYWPGQELAYEVRVEDHEDGTLDAGIDPAAVALSIEYLPQGKDINLISLGHQALAENSRYLAGKELITGSDCRSCHLANEKSVGPSYLDIAEKYRDQSTAVDYLSDKIINGGGGVWGEQAMAAHPQLSKEEAEKMSQYVLSISEKTEAERLSLSGSYRFEPDQDNPEGSYVIMTSYTDRGSDDVEPITAQKVTSLRYPRIYTADYATNEVAMRFEPNAEQLAGMGLSHLGEDMAILLGMNDGWAGYAEVDFTGVSELSFETFLVPGYAGGGKIEVRFGGPEGDLVGELQIPMNQANMGLKKHVLPVDAVGMKELYLIFDGIDDKMVCALIGIEFLSKMEAL